MPVTIMAMPPPNAARASLSCFGRSMISTSVTTKITPAMEAVAAGGKPYPRVTRESFKPVSSWLIFCILFTRSQALQRPSVHLCIRQNNTL